ncbi:hypothetical protein [Xanthomonas melonis]|uniref:hypothetical protein n=1 Tax=Xanthomonas melonis TaxID=56456 RepID=UPI003EB97A33
MSRMTDQELRATLYFAVGVTSESGYAAYRLEVAGDNLRTPLLEPADNSGYTIGTIQTDLGNTINRMCLTERTSQGIL